MACRWWCWSSRTPPTNRPTSGKAFEQLQTYKARIPDLFQYNEILVISDGSEARMGSLSANAERFVCSGARWMG